MSCLYVVNTKRKDGCEGSDHFLIKALPVIQGYGGRLILQSETDMGFQTILCFPDRERLELCIGSKSFRLLQRRRTNMYDYAYTFVDEAALVNYGT